jgi:hypothetical protein
MGSFVSSGISVVFTGDDSGTITAELVDVVKDPTKTDQVDVTHQESSDEHREFLSGLSDGQSITLLLNMDPDNVRPAEGESGSLVITFTWSGITLNTLTITCNVEEIGDIQAALGEKVTESIKFKISGKPAWSTV